MADGRTCPHCGKPVPTTALEGICPECMLQAGLASRTEAGPRGTKIISPPPEPDEISPLFPQLEILECLGRGGMGAVYKARQPKLDRFVALKILAREKESEPKFEERFTREARALARLNHPNIVTVYDFGEAAGHCYLLMEFVDGLSLRQLIQSKKLMPEEALTIVPRICEALQFAHEHGIIHRDIKPENILLDKAGRVKIADFGIAKILGREGERANLTADQQVIGTPHYMAPEQIEKPQLVDHRADIYSLGVVFYEMLTGELPLGKFAAPSKKVQVDVRLDEVVLHALENEPERRYQHASEVKTDVETIAATARLPLTTQRDQPRPAASGPRNREPELAPEVAGHSSATMPEAMARVFPRRVNVARWAARILGTALLLFYGVFILSEGLPPISSQPEGVQLNFIALGILLAGFAVGWMREGTAALLIASGWTLWQISESHVRWNLFQTPLPVAALYGYCWWATRGRRTGVVLATAAALAAALGLGRWFCPTNVFVRGVVTDAATGKGVPNAELTLFPQPKRNPNEPDRPDARSAADGSFRLYVGWYTEGKELRITAPGYVLLLTNLGPRSPGRRDVNRDFQLQPGAKAAGLPWPVAASGNVKPDYGAAQPNSSEATTHGAPGASASASPAVATPPVVISTVPESGAADVDPALREIRVTFSHPMQDGSWSWSTWGEENYPETTGDPRYLEDGRTCALPVELRPGRLYALWLNSGKFHNFKDREGEPAVPYLLIFETRK